MTLVDIDSGITPLPIAPVEPTYVDSEDQVLEIGALVGYSQDAVTGEWDEDTESYPNERAFDFGKVVALLPDGTVDVQWDNAPFDTTGAQVAYTEKPRNLQRVTAMEQEWYSRGREDGFEQGCRAATSSFRRAMCIDELSEPPYRYGG